MISRPHAILQQRLFHRFGSVDVKLNAVGGGSINESYRVTVNNQTVFCKINSATKFPQLFSTEAAGLRRIAAQKIIRTPEVLDCFETAGQQFLLLEWIAEGERTQTFWKRFGEQLAALHRVHHTHVGLDENNYMGSVPQSNQLQESWTQFFAAERITPMVDRCAAQRLLQPSHLRLFVHLQKKLEDIFNDEPPSLLHGDLWSGNFMCSQDEEPILIDPAVYYGHRSMDLGMTTLFGGFDPLFYEAYHYHYRLPSNYKEQWAVCNLYPLLIHLYLFGTSYLAQIERTLKAFA